MLSIPHYLRLPSVCLICNMSFKAPNPICGRCEVDIKIIGSVCQSCGNPSQKPFCIDCQQQGSILHRLYLGYPYQDPLKTLISLFKFHEGLDLCSYLTEKIIAILPPEAYQTECLVPIPLHRKRLAKRGYNQSLLLCKALSRLTGIPYQHQLCQKISETKAQATLDKSQRQINLMDSFQCNPSNDKHITLIDDVCTAGATLNAIAQGFQYQGVGKIDAWVICKA